MHFPVTHNLQGYYTQNNVNFFLYFPKYANLKVRNTRINAFFFLVFTSNYETKKTALPSE